MSGLINNRDKTHCNSGHEFTPENTCLTTRGGWRHRRCRACSVEYTRRYEKSHPRQTRPPGQQQAWNRIEWLLRSKQLVAQPCVVCANPKTAAHHPRGYLGDAALDIEWLCQRHHNEAHRRAAA